MLGENIKAMRKSKGISQEELAVRLSVVRQTVSKWERDRSVSDADLLVRLSEELGVPVSALLGDSAAKGAHEPDDLHAVAEKLEVVNRRLALVAERRRAALIACGVAFVAMALVLLCLAAMGDWYLAWDLGDPETAVAAVFHGFSWVFIRLSPVLLAASAAGLCLAWRRD